jgi:hypothetical protein
MEEKHQEQKEESTRPHSRRPVEDAATYEPGLTLAMLRRRHPAQRQNGQPMLELPWYRMWLRPWSGSAQSVFAGCPAVLSFMGVIFEKASSLSARRARPPENNPDNLFCFHGFGIQMHTGAPAKRQIDLCEMERMTVQHDFRFIHAGHSIDLFEREAAGIDLFEQPVKSAKKRLRPIVPLTPEPCRKKLMQELFKPDHFLVIHGGDSEDVSKFIRTSGLDVREPTSKVVRLSDFHGSRRSRVA